MQAAFRRKRLSRSFRSSSTAAMPPKWISQPCMMGIDEAGRGPVLGPMVYAVAYCPLGHKQALSKREFADSKTLKEEKRTALFAEIQNDQEMGFEVDSISASRISTQMLRSDKVSLNAIANDSTFDLIDRVLALGVNLKEVYCDTVGDASKWQDRLAKKYPAIRFTVCPKADALYPIVSAASIVAKVTRDCQLKDFEVHEGLGCSHAYGSGYPGDPVTVTWLAANMDPVFGFPDIVRFSWQTASRLLDERAVKVAWECDEGVEASQRKLSFGSRSTKQGPSSGLGRHSYFQARRLQRLEQF